MQKVNRIKRVIAGAILALTLFLAINPPVYSVQLYLEGSSASDLEQPVVVSFTPTKTDRFKLTCGMDMFRGSLIVP